MKHPILRFFQNLRFFKSRITQSTKKMTLVCSFVPIKIFQFVPNKISWLTVDVSWSYMVQIGQNGTIKLFC